MAVVRSTEGFKAFLCACIAASAALGSSVVAGLRSMEAIEIFSGACLFTNVFADCDPVGDAVEGARSGQADD